MIGLGSGRLCPVWSSAIARADDLLPWKSQRQHAVRRLVYNRFSPCNAASCWLHRHWNRNFPDPARKQQFEVLFPVGHFWSKIVTSKKLFDFGIERWRSPPATISPLALHKDIREDIMAATQPVATVLEPDIRAPIQQLA